jgi:hypothetical protein
VPSLEIYNVLLGNSYFMSEIQYIECSCSASSSRPTIIFFTLFSSPPNTHILLVFAKKYGKLVLVAHKFVLVMVTVITWKMHPAEF